MERRPNGKLLIIGGSEELPNACVLTALAAMRAGVDEVKVAAPESIALLMNSQTLDIITIKLGEFGKHTKEVLEMCRAYDALILGPGMEDKPVNRKFVCDVLEGVSIPTIVSWEAVRLVDDRKLLAGKLVATTMHEFEKLAGVKLEEDPKKTMEQAQKLAKDLGAVVVLDEMIDYVADSENAYTSDYGNIGMTVFGVSYTMLGIMGAMLSQKNSQYLSAVGASFVNNKAGDAAFMELGISFVASDVIRHIPEVIMKETLQRE